ncbi:MAG: trans-splicing intein-formed DNA polymerase III subunit alpha N-terminal partner DnaE-N, partial [Cyanobacteria bacterium P01_F01_bin.42]
GDMAIRIEGTNKTFGVHAAGVVIASEPLDQIVPLQKNNDGSVITQYFMEDLESLGLLKMDFLGLKNLTMIQKAVDLIKEHRSIDIDPDDIPLTDPNTFNLLARGELQGIFQLESSGMRQVVKDLKPSNLEDISSILALYRPGPLDAGLIPKFINRKHGREAIDYPHELIQPILHETYGIMVYQEQIMKIAQDMAGYSLGQADLLRRAMGKKKVAEMQKHRTIFIEGAEEKGVKTKTASDLFDQMILFAEYCLSPDTPVLTLEYGWVALGDLVKHELNCHLFSLTEQGYLVTQPVAQWHHRGEQEIFEYELEDGSTIRATANHRFMTQTGEMMAINDIFEQGLELHQLQQLDLAQAS